MRSCSRIVSRNTSPLHVDARRSRTINVMWSRRMEPWCARRWAVRGSSECRCISNYARSTRYCAWWSIAFNPPSSSRRKCSGASRCAECMTRPGRRCNVCWPLGVLSEDRQRDLREWVRQIDPLALSERLDALRYALLCGADGRAWHQPRSPLWGALYSVPLPAPEEEPEWTGHREAPSSGKEIGHQALERAAAAPVETLLHGLGTIHPCGRKFGP